MSEWQPIETAPRDHSAFLAYEPKFGRIVLMYGGDAEDGTPMWDDTVQEHWPRYKPTHWMPLPLPPTSG